MSNKETEIDIIKEYRDLLRVNGMPEEEVNGLTSIDEHKVALAMQKKLNALQKKADPTPEPKKSEVLGIDMSKENAAALASDIAECLKENSFDERVLEDERYKRDNQMVTETAIPGDTVILRSKEGYVL